MKTYSQFISEANKTRLSSSITESTNFRLMREWIISQVEQSDRAHDKIKKDFDNKHAKGDKKLLAYFDKVVDSIVL